MNSLPVLDLSSEDLLVSIVVPLFNHERYVAEAIQSLIRQTHTDLELIVIDDGSSDGSVQEVVFLEDACTSRFKHFSLVRQGNAGVANVLNRGMAIAKGRFVFLLASDDVAEPTAVARLLSRMISDDAIALACGDADFIDENSQPCSLSRNGSRYTSFIKFNTDHRIDIDLSRNFGRYETFINGNYLTVGILLRKSFVLEVGGYDAQCVIEDLDLWLKLSRHYKFVFIDEILVHYRQHNQSASKTRLDAIVFDELKLLIREAGECQARGIGPAWAARTRSVIDWLKSRSIEHKENLVRTTMQLDGALAELDDWRRFDCSSTYGMPNSNTQQVQSVGAIGTKANPIFRGRSIMILVRWLYNAVRGRV